MFDKDLFLSLCEKYNVQFSDEYDEPMVIHNGEINTVYEFIESMLEKHTPKKIVKDGEDESDWVYCPCCNELLGTNEDAYESFYANNWEAIYCHKCGQLLSWKTDILVVEGFGNYD